MAAISNQNIQCSNEQLPIRTETEWWKQNQHKLNGNWFFEEWLKILMLFAPFNRPNNILFNNEERFQWLGFQNFHFIYFIHSFVHWGTVIYVFFCVYLASEWNKMIWNQFWLHFIELETEFIFVSLFSFFLLSLFLVYHTSKSYWSVLKKKP